MATKSKSILKIALFIIIAFLGSSFSGVVLAKSKSPSDKKLLIDFDKSFKEIAVNLSSNLPSIDKELFKRVVTLRTNKIVGREEVTEDRLRVAFLVHTKVDVHMVSKVMKQRKKERDFFGVLGKHRDEKRDSNFKKQLESLVGYSVYTMDFIETSRDFWKAKSSTLKESRLTAHNEIRQKETQLLKKEVLAEIKNKNQSDTNQASKDKLKSWIEADKQPWMLSDDKLMKLSNTTYHTGNRCAPLAVTLKNALRACENLVFFNTVLDMQCPKSKDSIDAIFAFIRFEGKWVSRSRTLTKYQYDKKNKAIFEKLKEDFKQSQKGKCPDGSDLIQVMSFRAD